MLNGALELGVGTIWLSRCLVACLRVALRGFKALGRDVRLSARRGLPPEGGQCPCLCRRASPAWSFLHSTMALRRHLRYSRLVLALLMPRGFVEGGAVARVVVLCPLHVCLSPRRSCLRSMYFRSFLLRRRHVVCRSRLGSSGPPLALKPEGRSFFP